MRVDKADWLDFAASLAPVSVDMLYVDPPFNTGKTQYTPTRAAAAKDRRGTTTRTTKYQDAWPTMPDYIAWLRARLTATLPAMKPSANLLIHCDWRASHHIRLLLDDLLGADRFVNHLIWRYGLGGSSPRCFARKHDDILFYCINPALAYFQAPRIAATSRRLAGQTKKATDVLDIPSLNNMSRERTGYPTQKPLALLDMLIAACSPPAGLVIDPCCGSGTTLLAAHRQGRRFAGCDINPAAVAVARKRLANT
ncbi:MAG TPA: site-specific DNA-methyltransferase [Phycisphaerales bacterium]|nr:site-specific DNA-methyltransferase [Phycisphaerales bacterium]